MAFNWPELCLGKAPGGGIEPTLFRVFDIGQTDEPSLGRQQQTGRFLPRRESEDHAADHSLGIVVGPGPPDLHQAAQLERAVDQAILEILEPREIAEPAAVRNGDAHSGRILVGLRVILLVNSSSRMTSDYGSLCLHFGAARGSPQEAVPIDRDLLERFIPGSASDRGNEIILLR